MPRLENSKLLILVDATQDGIALRSIHDVIAKRDYLQHPSPLFKFAANNDEAFFSNQGVSSLVEYDPEDGSQFQIRARSPHGDVEFVLHARLRSDSTVAAFDLTAINLTAANMFLRVVMPCITSVATPGNPADMMGMVPQEGGWVAPLSRANPWGAPCQQLGMKFFIDVGLPNSRNNMELASIYDRVLGGGIFFCDVDGDLEKGTPPLQLTLDPSSVLGFWIGNIPPNQSPKNSVRLSRLAIGVHPDGDWHEAVDYYTSIHRPHWRFPSTPAWLASAGAIYSPTAGGSGGIYLSLPSRALGPWSSPDGVVHNGVISSFLELPNLFAEATALGTNVLYLTDYWEGGYLNKGDYKPRWDLGGPSDFQTGIASVHQAGGRVILYVEPFIIFRSSEVGKKHGPDWGGRDWDGALWGIDKRGPYPDYADNFEMISAFVGWQDYFLEVVVGLVRDFGVDGIFLDSYAWQMNRPMHNNLVKSPYSAEDFSLGVLQLVRAVRANVQAWNPDVVVLGETTAGPVAQCWDGGLNADLGFGNIWSFDSNPDSQENRNAPERFIASPVRYGIPQVRIFGNGRTLKGLHQFFAAGHGLALSSNYPDAGFIFDNADHIRALVDIRVTYQDALIHGLQINQPRTGDPNVIAYQYQGSTNRILMILNIGDTDVMTDISLGTADPGGRWMDLLDKKTFFWTNGGGLFKNIVLTQGPGDLLVLLHTYVPGPSKVKHPLNF